MVLQQLADDAHTGLSSTHALLEAVGVAVFTVDRSGLVVTANRRANAVLGADLVGVPARTVLPAELCHLLWDSGQQTRDNETRFNRGGRWLQCKVNPLEAADGCRGKVVTIWEEVR
jgi:PAS domain-containing protein